MNRNDWAHEFFTRIGVPNNHRSVAANACIAQMQAEGGSALFNPLNCVMDMHVVGQTNYNSIGVKNYPDFETGMEATVRTIEQNCCGFPLILKRYRNSGASAFRICRAIRKSQWGTGPLIYAVLADIKVSGLYWEYAGQRVAGT
jgi:hypothetical protein